MSIPRNATAAFIVPTKLEDNCSYSTSLMQQVVGDEQESEMDAFQYYSSDLLRLKTLLFSSDQDDDELSALAAVNEVLRRAGLSTLTANRISNDKDKGASNSKRRRGNNSQAIKQIHQKDSRTPRKTRLTWELHPSLLLHDLYDDDGEDIHFISDDEDDDCKEMDLIVKLLNKS